MFEICLIEAALDDVALKNKKLSSANRRCIIDGPGLLIQHPLILHFQLHFSTLKISLPQIIEINTETMDLLAVDPSLEE